MPPHAPARNPNPIDRKQWAAAVTIMGEVEGEGEDGARVGEEELSVGIKFALVRGTSLWMATSQRSDTGDTMLSEID